MSNQCDIQINPDIIGIGVRISLYILSLAGPILSLFSASDALLRSIETSMGLTGLAVLLTTFVYSGEKTLDLFHALCIFHLVGLAGVSIRPKRDVRQKQITQAIFEVVYLGGTLGLLIFMISVFARAKSFGPKPQCNDGVMYVMFGVNVSAINPTFRALFLANFALMLVGLPVSYLVWSARKERYCSDEEEFAGIRVMSDVAGRCYLIAMLELMIKRNNTTSDGSDWSFGQILAMMMLLGPLIEFVSAFFKDGNQDDDGWEFKFQLAVFFGIPLMRMIEAAFDFAFCAAAGAAAAATGAHVAGSLVTTRIVQLGALGGVMSSGILNYSLLVALTGSSVVVLGLAFAITTFGNAFIVTLLMGDKVLGSTPNAMLVGAIAAGAPLLLGSGIAQAGAANFSSLPLGAAFDTLAGYTFARVSLNHGFYVCPNNAAAAAGAVYGVLMFVFRLPQSCAVWSYQEKERKRLRREGFHGGDHHWRKLMSAEGQLGFQRALAGMMQ